MFGAWFKRMVREAISEPVQPQLQSSLGNMSLERGLDGTSPALIAFRISNGFVVLSRDTSNDVIGRHTASSGFTYCKDAQAIAEHIVASAMKDKLGIQSDLFEQEKQAAMAQQAVRPRR